MCRILTQNSIRMKAKLQAKIEDPVESVSTHVMRYIAMKDKV